MKSLKPTMREKKRYVLFEMPSVSSRDEAKKIIESSIRNYLGELGLGKACLEFVDFNEKNHRGIFAVNREELDKVRGALVLSKTQVLVKKVSGAINKLR